MAEDTTFAEAGLDSLAAVEARDMLARRLGTALPATILFDTPHPAALAAALEEQLAERAEVVPMGAADGLAALAGPPVRSTSVAIYTTASRFPTPVGNSPGAWAWIRVHAFLSGE